MIYWLNLSKSSINGRSDTVLVSKKNIKYFVGILDFYNEENSYQYIGILSGIFRR